MNNAYGLVWKAASQMWVPVPENTRVKGGAVVVASAAVMLLCADMAVAAPDVNQLPTGGNVVGGQATIQSSGNTMNINQTTGRAAIDWNTFNVGSNARVNFNQPSASSVTLNRVLDSNPSQIFGQITATGQVFLTNPNGVYFSPKASVDVGALVATTHSMNTDDFMNGATTFSRDGATGSVINEGNLSTTGIAGYIALLASEVRNEGVIIAKAGTVALASGEAITLDLGTDGSLTGITATPSQIETLVENRQAVLAPDGLIILSAHAANSLQGGAIKNSGSLEATSLTSKGGKIVLGGDHITLASNSTIDASGALGGGEIYVGGEWQGSGDMTQATTVTMETEAAIKANATDNGDGGTVVLWSDVSNVTSVTAAHGILEAKGGVSGGDGGRIETSGAKLDVAGISVNASATRGTNGQWLLDPNNITINNGGTTTAGSSSLPGYVAQTDSSVIDRDDILTQLNNGTDVTVQTGSGGTEDGNITVDTSIQVTSTTGNANLTLKAHNNITVNDGNTIATNGGNITLWSDTDGNGGYIYILDNVTLDSRTISDRNASNTSTASGGGTITLGGGTAGTSTPTGFALQSNGADAAVAGITLGTTDGSYPDDTGSDSAVHDTNITFYSGGGDISLNGKATDSSSSRIFGVYAQDGIAFDAGAAGNISVTGEATGKTDTRGVLIGSRTISNVSTHLRTGSGNINISGTASGASGFNHGVSLNGHSTNWGTLEATNGGNITVTGSGSGTSPLDFRIYIYNILANTGTITVNGTQSGADGFVQYSNFGSGTLSGAGNDGLTNNPGVIDVNVGASSSNIIFNEDNLTNNNWTGRVRTSGELTLAPYNTSFTNAITWNDTLLNVNSTGGATLSGLTIGKSGNTANITMTKSETVSGDIALYGGDLTINNPMTATNSTITLDGSGTVSDGASGYLIADKLALLDGAVTFDHASNDVNTIAGSGLDSVAFTDADDVEIGTVDSTNGMSASGTTTIETKTGNLTVSQNVSGSTTVLNAGKDTAAGTSTGGNIIVSGSPTISATTGNAILYTGSVSGSSGLTSLIGSGSGNFRYNSDEVATNFTKAIGATGTYAVYREQPTATIRPSDETIIYGNSPSLAVDLGGVNGDTAAQALSTQPTVTVGSSLDSNGNYAEGTHSMTAAGAADQFGYTLAYGTGTLTVSAQPVVTPPTVTPSTPATNTNTSQTNTGLANTSPQSAMNIEVLATPGAQTTVNAGEGAESAAQTVGTGGITISLEQARDNVETNQAGIVTVTLPKNTAAKGTGFSFALPEKVVKNVNHETATVLRADGGALPAWLKYDPASRKFEATSVPNQGLPLEVIVKSGDTEFLVVISERTK
ncbi:filamentous hemagglutinin N-terminal domain-containing protein [Terasakiella sp. SH-1]|uniref:two-partner secretion domain-containing protein n=1 Tax=Terasakiella sp. SH-1 TaxID=2560057 RepID=UPI0010749C8A|nr:filamentous hemagglutinin N-terminal domain-containing protein [Terasakiella sp. SH-1]